MLKSFAPGVGARHGSGVRFPRSTAPRVLSIRATSEIGEDGGMERIEIPPSELRLRPLDANYEAVHGFSDYSAWIIQGRLMQGRYPYVEPSRAT